MRYLTCFIIFIFMSSCNFVSLVSDDTKTKTENKKSQLVITYPKIDGMEYIPGGIFKMGSNRKKDERPVRDVFIEGFYLDKTEVSVADFRKFANATNRKMPKQPDWNYEEHPVVNVSWNEASDYARWVGKRLPTEAEWEYAARGGKLNYEYVYQNSQQYGKNYENIADESMRSVKYHFPVVNGYDDGYVYTSPVAMFAPNKFGIHDLNGNVLEWCSDWYNDYKKSEVKNPVGPPSGEYKVIRGASWNRSGSYMRATNRTYYGTQVRFDFLGFRCAKDAELPITQRSSN